MRIIYPRFFVFPLQLQAKSVYIDVLLSASFFNRKLAER